MGLTQERLKELLHYDPETGEFTWLVDHCRVRIGCRAGTKAKDDYVHITVDKHRTLAHRLAWLYMTGRWPNGIIDHANLNKSDNRFCNLREATFQQNNVNRKAKAASGYKGVCRVGSRWKAMIWAGGTSRHLGYFDSAEDAHLAYVEASKKTHGEFSRAA